MPARSALRITTDRQALAWIALTGAICLVAFWATVPLPRVDHHLIGSDGVNYYAIARSLILDRDVDFTNDYGLLGVQAAQPTPTGLPANPFAIGAAILWAPFFLVAHALSLLLRGVGLPAPTDGVSYIYEISVCSATVVYTTLGFALTYHTVRRALEVDVAPSLWGVIAMWLATPAIYYVIAEPSMSHGLTIFSSAAFLASWYRPSPRRPMWGWATLGLATGLCALVRWQDGIVALIPLAELGWWLLRRELSLARGLSALAVFGLAAIVAFSPQMIVWNILYGAPLAIPQGDGFMRWAAPQILPTLFSTRHGLIAWHPIVLLALLGLVPLWRRSRPLALVVGWMFMGELYINSAVSRWWADDAFGGRRFTSLAPFLTIALAALLSDGLGRRAAPADGQGRRAALGQGREGRAVPAEGLGRWVAPAEGLGRWVAPALIALIIWNGLSFVQYRLRLVSMSEALTIQEMTVDRLLLPVRLAQLALR